MHLLPALARKSSFSKAQGFMKPASLLTVRLPTKSHPDQIRRVGGAEEVKLATEDVGRCGRRRGDEA